MKIGLLILGLSLSHSVFAQFEFNWGFYIQPKYSTFIYNVDGNPAKVNNFSFLIGGEVLFEKERFEISTGLNLSRLSANHIDYSLSFVCDFDPVNGIDIYNSYARETHEIYYYGLPLNFNYHILENRNLYLKLGGTFYVKASDSFDHFLVECREVESEINLRQIVTVKNTLTTLNLGIAYEFIKEKFTLYIEPIIEYSIDQVFDEGIIINTSYNEDIPNNLNTLEFGLRVGFKL